MGKIIRLVLEGSPCSGKSVAVQCLKKMKTRIPVVFVDEVATEILREDRDFVRRDKIGFQKEVLRRQTLRETEASRQCLSGQPLTVMILDRGAADMFVYLPEETAKCVTGMQAEDLLSRYDAVFHFEPYIERASVRSGNDLRAEDDMAEVMALHEKSLSVWGRHPRMVKIPVFETREQKGKYVAAQINALVQTEVFIQ